MSEKKDRKAHRALITLFQIMIYELLNTPVLPRLKVNIRVISGA